MADVDTPTHFSRDIVGTPGSTVNLKEVPITASSGQPTLIYPLDLKEQSFYPESIKFTVYKRQSSSFKKVMKAFEDAWDDFTLEDRIAKTKGIEGLDPLGPSELSGRKYSAKQRKEMQEAGNKIRQMKKDVSMGERIEKIYDDSLLKEIVRFMKAAAPSLVVGLNQRNIKNMGKKDILGQVYMNMPNEISFAEPVDWEGTELGLVGALTKQDASMITTGAMSHFGNLIGGGSGALAGMLTKKVGAQVGMILGTLGGTSAQRAMESSFGNIHNPYKEMTFSGIGFREFNFNFVFRARNYDEVKMVQNIIELFRFHSKPRFAHGSNVLDYPDEFRIQFLTTQKMTNKDLITKGGNILKKSKATIDRFETNTFIPQIKMCVCKGVNTNFTSQNTWRALKNGHPVEISLQLNFQETELVTGMDVIGAGTIGRFGNTGEKF